MTPGSDRYITRADTIRDISPHPTNDNLVLTASDDGFARLHDMRSPDNRHRAAGEIRLNTECTAIKYHPGVEPLFVLCDKSGNALLHDSRMAFRDRTYTSGYSPHVLPVPHVLQVLASSAGTWSRTHLKTTFPLTIFDTTGSKFAITFMGHYPTIYSPNDPYPLAYCTGRTLPDGSPIPSGERTYSNSATMKHGSFGGSDYYSAGSDDFRSYIWKIPPKSYLEEHRRPMTSSDWLNQTDADQTAPLFVTRSERTRILLALLGERTAFDEMDDIGAEDAGSIAMFDEILRQEGDIDIFLRPASDDEEDEDEDDDPEELESLRSRRHCLRCEEDSESGSDSESSSDEFDL
ncbi:hypothetical protein FRB99_000273 [Tulasnella sp. 403]|nr:hypothetical protein FRB99_000273 [Tulasnella sp. 403]